MIDSDELGIIRFKIQDKSYDLNDLVDKILQCLDENVQEDVDFLHKGLSVILEELKAVVSIATHTLDEIDKRVRE